MTILQSQLPFKCYKTWVTVNLSAFGWEEGKQSGATAVLAPLRWETRGHNEVVGVFFGSCRFDVRSSHRSFHLTHFKPFDPWCPLEDDRKKKHPHLLPCRRVCVCRQGARKHTHGVLTSTWSSHFLRKLQSQLNLADGPWTHAPVWAAAWEPWCSCVQNVHVKAGVNHTSWCLLLKCWLKSHSWIGEVWLAIWTLIQQAHSASSFVSHQSGVFADQSSPHLHSMGAPIRFLSVCNHLLVSSSA